MCEPATLTAIGTWIGGLFTGGAAAGGTAAGAAAAGTATGAGVAGVAATSAAAVSGTAATGAGVAGVAATSAAAVSGTAAAGLTTAQLIALGVSAASAAAGAYGQISAAGVTKQVGKNNARISRYAAEQRLRKGELDAQEVQRRAAQLRGRQRSMLAARGLDLNTGTPSDIIEQTDFFAQTDADTARFNARQDAWGIVNQGRNMAAVSRADAAGQRAQGGATLAGGAATVAEKWYNFNYAGA